MQRTHKQVGHNQNQNYAMLRFQFHSGFFNYNLMTLAREWMYLPPIKSQILEKTTVPVSTTHIAGLT